MRTVRFGIGLSDSKSTFNTKYDKGYSPACIGLNNNNILVEIHESSTLASDALRYCVSKVSEKGIAWGSMNSHTKGHKPCIAINDDGTVIELHSSSSNLFFSIGEINKNNDDILWKNDDGTKFWEGDYPSVALTNNGIIAETHINSDNNIMFNLGIIDTSNKGSIKWITKNEDPLDNALTPMKDAPASIAMNNNGVIIITYQCSNTLLYYHLGVYDATTQEVTWKIKAKAFDNQSTQLYASEPDKFRARPLVSINDNNEVVITSYNSQGLISGFFNDTYADSTGIGVLYMYNAYWDSNILTFQNYNNCCDPIAFDNGCNPSVACNTSFAVQVHDDGDPVNQSFYGTMSIFLDRTNLQLSTGILDRKFWQTTFLGTHDSCTYKFVNSGNSLSKCAPSGWFDIQWPAPWTPEDTARAQQDRIVDQLRGGVRYIDIRVCKNQYDNDIFYTYHAIIAIKVEEILDDINKFIGEATSELVVVNFSHLCNFSQDDHAKLISLIQKKLGTKISPNINSKTPISDIYNSSIKDLLKGDVDEVTKEKKNCKTTVLIVYQDQKTDDDGYNMSPQPYPNYLTTLETPLAGFVPTLNVYDCYSKSNDFDNMRDIQWQRVQKYATSLPATMLKTVINLNPTVNSKNPDLDTNGDCLPVAAQQLYLLSWTLTETGGNLTGLHNLSTEANRNLSTFLYDYICNDNDGVNKNWVPKYLINVLYLDFYSDARGTEMTYLLNKNS